MNRQSLSKALYERPVTTRVSVEVEHFCAGSTTNYDNAGSAGNGEYKDNPFEEFGSVTNASASGSSSDSFDSWTNY